nr:ribonuclease H-like domain-containing protein [Tanacetum cinerariifolium]
MTVAITTEDMQKRRNDVKARTTLLFALPDEHQLGFSKLQAIMSHLEFMDVKIEQDDLNQKFLTSLAPEWLMYIIVWKNKDDLDKMSLDDVYNHLKVYEPEVQKKSDSNSQNMAFISSSNTSSGKGKVHTASVPTASTQVSTASTDVTAASISHDTEENHALVADDEAPTEFAFMAKSSSSSENEVYDDSYCSKSCRKNTKNLNTKNSKLSEKLSDCETNLYHYKLGLSHVEARLVEFKSQEIKFCEKIRGLKRDVEVRNNKIKYLMNELEQVKKEKEGLDSKLYFSCLTSQSIIFIGSSIKRSLSSSWISSSGMATFASDKHLFSVALLAIMRSLQMVSDLNNLLRCFMDNLWTKHVLGLNDFMKLVLLSIYTKVAAVKLPVLNSNEFKLWKMRIEQYFLMIDYALWKVILNGDSPPLTRSVKGVETLYPPTTVEKKLARKNELKYRAINTAHGVSAASSKTNASNLPDVDSLSDAVIYSFFASQSNITQLDNEYLKQIDLDDLEEMDLKWQMAMLTIRARRFLLKTGRNLGVKGTETIGFDKTKVECYNCHRKGHFARESKACNHQDNRNRKAPRRTVPAEDGPTNFARMAYTSSSSSSSSNLDTEVSTCSKSCLKSYETLKEHYDNLIKDFNKSQFNLGAYKAGLASVEARLEVYKKNKAIFEDDIKILKLEVMLKDKAITKLRQKFKKAKKERDYLKLTLEKFEGLSKNLSRLLNSQQSDKSKTGLGYDSQGVDSQMLENHVNDKYNIGEGYHAVPPPYTGNYMPPKLDLVFADEHVVSESVTSLPDIAKSKVKTSETKLKNVNAPIIKNWVSDSEDKDEIETKSKQIKPSFAKEKFVKSTEHVKSTRKYIKQEESNRQTKYPRKTSQSPRGNQRNWNNLMTQRLGDNFKFKNKACYECGSFNHLIKDYYSYKKKKMVEKPVWNIVRRVNHQNSQRLSHSHSKTNFVPKAVLTNSGLKTLNTARLPFSRATVTVTTARPINTAYPRSTVNGAKPSSNEMLLIISLKTVDHTCLKDLTMLIFKDQRIFDSRCSRHMTGNKSFLIDYQEIDGGFVAFEGSPKGGKITGNGKIRTGKLDFEDNRVLVIKPYNKTPYELLIGRSPNIDFIKPFGYPVTILNTLDHLGKFKRKADEGFLVGYSVNRRGLEWIFDIDSLIKSMTYEPVTAGNQTYDDASIEINSSDDKDADEVPGKKDEGISKGSEIDDQEMSNSSTQDVNTVGLSINTANTNINTGSLNINNVGSNDPSMSTLEETSIFNDVYDDREVGVEADTNNLELSIVKKPYMVFIKLLEPGMKHLSTYLLENGFIRGTIDKTLFIKKDRDDTQEIPNELYGGTYFLLRIIEAEDVNVHLYRSMIGSLMRLTASRPGIMFAICACTRDSSFDLEAFSCSDYAGASLDKKSTIGVSPTIYTSCIKQFWTSAKVKTINEDVQLQALVDGKMVIVNEASIRRDLRLDDAEGTACLPNADIFEELARMRGSTSPKGNRGRQLWFLTLSHKLRNIYLHILMIHYLVTNQAAEIEMLKKRVKKLEGKKKKRTHELKRLYKGRIGEINANGDLSLINETAQDQERINDQDMFGFNDLDGDEVVVDASAGEKEDQSEKVAKKEVSTADPVTTAGEVVTTADVEVSATLTTTTKIDDDVTLAQTLIEIKAAKPKAATTVTAIIMDEQITRNLEAQMQDDLEEEQRIVKQKEENANIAMIAK